MSKHDRILAKVQRLLKLAESPNVHEATVAAAQAQALMARYRIASVDVESTEEEQERDAPVGLHDAGRETAKWQWSLLWEICRANGCKPWACYPGGKRTYQVVGTEAAASTVIYLYRYLVRAIEDDLTRRRRSKKISGRADCHAFRVGAIREIGARLRAANREAARESAALPAGAAGGASETVALACVESTEAVDRFMAAANLSYGKARSTRVSSLGAYAQGRAFGRSVALGGGAALASGDRAIE